MAWMKLRQKALLFVIAVIGLSIGNCSFMPDFAQSSAALAQKAANWKAGLKGYLLAEQVRAELDQYLYSLGQYAMAHDQAAKQAASASLDQLNSTTSAYVRAMDSMAGGAGQYGEQLAHIAKSAQSQLARLREMRALLAAPSNGSRHTYKNPQQDELMQFLATMRKSLAARDEIAAAAGKTGDLKDLVVYQFQLADASDSFAAADTSVGRDSEKDRKRGIDENTVKLIADLKILEKLAALSPSMQAITSDSLTAFKSYLAISRQILDIYAKERIDVAQYKARKLYGERKKGLDAYELARDRLRQKILKEI
jgi:hypothetical protein